MADLPFSLEEQSDWVGTSAGVRGANCACLHLLRADNKDVGARVPTKALSVAYQATGTVSRNCSGDPSGTAV